MKLKITTDKHGINRVDCPMLGWKTTTATCEWCDWSEIVIPNFNVECKWEELKNYKKAGDK